MTVPEFPKRKDFSDDSIAAFELFVEDCFRLEPAYAYDPRTGEMFHLRNGEWWETNYIPRPENE